MRQRTLRAPSAQAPSRSLVSPIRLRSRQVSCMTGSNPAAATRADPACDDMCAEEVGLSVTLTASAYPTRPRAWSRTGPGSADRGGTTSAVTQNVPS